MPNIFYIERLPERELKDIALNFSKEFFIFKLFGYFIVFSSVFFLIVLLLKSPQIIFPYFAVCVIGIIGLIMLRYSYKSINSRKEIYKLGSVIHGKVVEHKRAFNIFSSNRYYVLVVKDDLGSFKVIKSSSKKLWVNNPVGAQLIGLKYKSDTFFGEEVGVSFSVNKKS